MRSTDCAYHFYWEWVEHTRSGQPFVSGSNEGWATGVIGEIKIDDHWDNQCQHLERKAPLCQKVSEVCVDGPSTRNIKGVNMIAGDTKLYTNL